MRHLRRGRDGVGVAVGRVEREPPREGDRERVAPVPRLLGERHQGSVGGRRQERRAVVGDVRRLEAEPEEGVGTERQRVRPRPDRRERGAAEELRHAAPGAAREIQVGPLRVAGEVHDREERLVSVLANVCQHVAVRAGDDLEPAPGEGRVPAAQRDDALHPPQQRRRVALLGGDVDGLEVVLGIHDERQVEPLSVRLGEAGVAVGAPLHRRAHRVAIAEEVVVAHADLVAVVEDGGAGQREEEPEEKLELAPRPGQRRETAADPEVDPGDRVRGVGPVQVVALLVRDHLERQLVVVPQEDGPLGGLRDRRRLLEDVEDREPVLRADRHEDPRHEGEVEGHVALVAASRPEVRDRLLGPLVRLGEQEPIAVALVDVGPELAEEVVRRGEVLAVRALLLVQVGDRVEAEAVQPEVEPEVDDREHLLADARVLVVEVRLVAEEAVPVVRVGDRVPRPVGRLGVGEDDPGVAVPVRRVAPHVVLAPGTAGRRSPRPLEPGVLVGGVVQHELADHAQAASVGLGEERAHVSQRPVVGVDRRVVGDVVAVVASRRREEREQPQRRDAELDEVVELLGEAPEVADPVAVAVPERPHVDLVDDGVLVPIGRRGRALIAGASGAWHPPRVPALATVPGRRHAGPCYTPALTATTGRSSAGRGRSERGTVRAARQTPARTSPASRAAGAR